MTNMAVQTLLWAFPLAAKRLSSGWVFRLKSITQASKNLSI